MRNRCEPCIVEKYPCQIGTNKHFRIDFSFRRIQTGTGVVHAKSESATHIFALDNSGRKRGENDKCIEKNVKLKVEKNGIKSEK